MPNVNLPGVTFHFRDKFPEADADKCDRHVSLVLRFSYFLRIATKQVRHYFLFEQGE